MGFFDFLKQANINQGIEEYKKTAGAVLLDVRTPQEYQEGHILRMKLLKRKYVIIRNNLKRKLYYVIAMIRTNQIFVIIFCVTLMN